MDEVVELIEHRVCRQRTEEEDRAIEVHSLIRVLVQAGAKEIFLGTPPNAFTDLD